MLILSILLAGDVNTVIDPFPFEMENGTEPFGTGKSANSHLTFYNINCNSFILYSWEKKKCCTFFMKTPVNVFVW